MATARINLLRPAVPAAGAATRRRLARALWLVIAADVTAVLATGAAVARGHWLSHEVNVLQANVGNARELGRKYEELAASHRTVQRRLTALAALDGPSRSWPDLVREVLGAAPPGVTVTSVTVAPTGAAQITGSTGSHQAAGEYAVALQALGRFRRVDLVVTSRSAGAQALVQFQISAWLPASGTTEAGPKGGGPGTGATDGSR